MNIKTRIKKLEQNTDVQIEHLRLEALSIKTQAAQTANLESALAAVNRLASIVEMVTALHGGEPGQNAKLYGGIMSEDEPLAVLMKALQPFPDARIAAAQALIAAGGEQ